MSDIDNFLDGTTTKPVAPAGAQKQSSQIDDFLGDAPAPARGLKGWGQDIAASAVKGAISVPESLVGLADIPTGGRVGKFLANEGGDFGFRPKEAKEIVNDWHSDATKEAQRKFGEAKGIWDKAKTAIENPSVIANSVGESLFLMGAGGVAARGLMAATRLGELGAKGATLAGAIGEGITMAGSAAEQYRQETKDGLLTPTQSGLALATGGVGAAFGYASGKLAHKFGFGDADTMLAQGARGAARETEESAAARTGAAALQRTALSNIPKKVIQGAISEGFFEELPQSVAEQIFQNIALDKPWDTDLDSAAVMGVLSGGAMGGAASGYHGYAKYRADNANQLQGTTQSPPPVAPDSQRSPNPGLERVRQVFSEQLQHLQAQEEGEPTVPQAAPPDGAAVLARQQAEQQAARNAVTQANRAVSSPDDEIYQSTGMDATPSQRMGIDPAAGPLSAGAAIAVDTGVSAQMQQAAAIAQGQEAAPEEPVTSEPRKWREINIDEVTDPWERQFYDSLYDDELEPNDELPAVSDYLQNDDDIPDFDAASSVSEEDFLRALGATDEEIQDAINATSSRPQNPTGPTEGVISSQAYAAPVSQQSTASSTPAQASQVTSQPQQGTTNGPQAAQAQQSNAQPSQTGTAPAAQTAAATGAVTNGHTTTANTGAQTAPAAVPQAQTQSETIGIKGRNGKTYHVLTNELNSDKSLLRTFTAGGKPRGARIHRDNLDQTGEKRAADAAKNAKNPLFDVIARKHGGAFATAGAANRELLARGMQETHEVVEASGISSGATGYAIAKKPASPAMQQESAPPTQIATAPVQPQTADAQQSQTAPTVANDSGISIERPSTKAVEKAPLPPTDVRLGDKVVVNGEMHTVTAPLKDGRKVVGVIATNDSDTDSKNGVRKIFLKGDEAIKAKIAAADVAPATSESKAQQSSIDDVAQAKRKHQNSIQIAKQLNLAAGDEIGTLVFNDTKVATGVTITITSETGLSFGIIGKRGVSVMRGTVGADAIKAAIDRAFENGKRKDSYEQFIAARKAPASVESTPKADAAKQPQRAPAVSTPTASQLMQAAQDNGKLIVSTVGGKKAATPAAPLPMDGWRDNLIKMREYARGLIESKKIDAEQVRLAWNDSERLLSVIEGQNDELDAEMRSYEAKSDGDKPKVESQPAATPDQFANNKLFTADKVAAARARMKSKLGRLNSGIDPELLVDGMTIAGAYIESGVRNFTQYAKAMVDDMGDGVKPYLLSFWEGARNYPGLDNTGMTSVEESAAQHKVMLTPEVKEQAAEAVGTIEPKPAKRAKKTGANGDMTLTQDWGVTHINGYSDGRDQEVGNPTKKAFLKEAKTYLDQVSEALKAKGYESHPDRKGSPEKSVSVNEAGPAVSGDVTLTMKHPESGVNIYISIGGGTLRGMVPTTDSGVSIMLRTSSGSDRFASKGGNTWAPVNLSATDLAALIFGRANLSIEALTRKTLPIENPVSAANQSVAEPAPTTSTQTTGNIDTKSPQEKPNERTTVQSDGTQALEQVAAGAGQGTEGIGRTGADTAGGRDKRPTASAGADAAGVQGSRGGGGGTKRVHSAEAGNGGKVRKPGRLKKDSAKAAAEAAIGNDERPEVAGEPTSTPNVPATDFQITDETRLGQGGEVAKFNDNLAAIRALKAIEDQNRRATPEEQATLARYVGWGGLANAFPDPLTGKFKPAWEARGKELRDLLDDREFAAARRSTRNAHYTSKPVVQAMWRAVERLGFKGGLALETSMGVGNFLGLKPQGVPANFVGVEYDNLTARIAQALYPQATVLHSGFQNVPLADNAFALSIGNPPFGSESLRFQYKPELNGTSIHNQFFRASMDALRPSGIQAMVVSRFLMDAQDKSTRLALAKQAKLVAAIRLPDTAFKENARTEVVTDIIILQKLSPTEQAEMEFAVQAYTQRPEKSAVTEGERRALASKVPAWVETVEVADPLGGAPMTVNSYFQSNKANIMGVLERSGSMQHGADITVRLDSPASLEQMLTEAVDRLPRNIQDFGADVVDASERRHKSMSDALRIALAGQEVGHVQLNRDGVLERVIERETPEGGIEMGMQAITADSPWSYQLMQDDQGRWYRTEVVMDDAGKPVKIVREDGKVTRNNLTKRVTFERESDVPDSLRLGKTGFERLQAAVGLRDALKRQITLETADAAKGVMDGNRRELAKRYESFVAKFGPVNRPSNLNLLMTMPDGGLTAALEVSYQPEVTAARAKTSGLPISPEVAKPAPILTVRVVPKYEPATKAATPSDALAITLSEHGRVNVDRVAQLRGLSVEDATAELQAGDKPLVFKDPETQTWETADAYLSGNVRRKLNAAKAANMASNVKALEAVQPAAWSAADVTVMLGSTWVPPKVYANFAEHLSGGKANANFSKATNAFSLSLSDSTATASTWSSEGAGVEYILGRLMNSQPVVVMYKDENGSLKRDAEKTALAQLKAKEISAEFLDWVFKDGERRTALVDLFNEKFNTRVVRQRDGSHLTLPGKVPDSIIGMRRHQKNVIWRGITDNSLLMDHAVGAGKTFAAIARAMERRRMGLSKKPMIVVPNHLIDQWASDVYRLYPGAKVLAAGKKDFEAKRRRRLFGKIATGDWDIVLVPHSSFGFIGIDASTEQRFLQMEMDQALQAVRDAEDQAAEDGASGPRKPFGVKEAERLVEKIQARMDKLNSGTKDRLLTFEQLGVDDLTVDEAHEFKNLYYSSRMTGVRGMGDKTGSRKANDLYNKVRVLQENLANSVSFLTGTPISNSAVEMYTMMRFLAPKQLKDMGLEHFDAWRAQFVEASAAFEPTESGSLKEVTRLGRSWSNMRSLMDLYYEFTDAVSLEDIQRWYSEDNGGKPFPVPKVKGGDRQLVNVQPTPAQEAMLKEVIAGFNSLPDIQDPYDRNKERLRLMDRARKISLDVRAVDSRHPSDEAGGKLEQASTNIKRIYDQWSAEKGTQMVFLDRSVPKAKGDDKIIKEYDALLAKRDVALESGDDATFQSVQESLDRYDANEIAELRKAQSGGWNAYQQIKDNLIAAGMPASEVRFIQEANNDEQKQALFDAVNGGKVRVLIGSSQRMGAGTNAQKRLVGLHHIDVTWKPSDIEQREGRIIRQGNELLAKYGPSFEVEILAYATERTVDAKMWDLNATKLKTINGIRKYDGAFTMDFEDADSVSMAEMAALASGNPLLLERVKTESEINLLELQERSFRRRMYGAQDAVDSAQSIIARNPGRIEQAKKLEGQASDAIAAATQRQSQRRVTVEGKEYSTLRDALAAMKDAIEQQQGGKPTARYSITVDGQRLTNKEGIESAIGAALGDASLFEVKINGKEITQHTAAARELMDELNALTRGIKQGDSRSKTVGQMLGYDLALDANAYHAGSSGSQIDASLSLVDENDATVTSVSISTVAVNQSYVTGNLRNPVAGLFASIESLASHSNVQYMQHQLDRATKELPELRQKLGQTFPKTQELATKRARLRELVSLLDESKTSQTAATENPTIDSQSAQQEDGAEFKGSVAAAGTPTDRAIMDMVKDKADSRSVLKLIAQSSRKPFNRKLAQLILKTGVTPSLGYESAPGFPAKYARTANAITMTDAIGAIAEQVFLHEMIHATTLASLDRKGLASQQMRRLFDAIKKTPAISGQYGLKNVGEFVAEAFTNPNFQRQLQTIQVAPSGAVKTAWDRFVRILKGILGLPNDSVDALSQALELGVSVMRENMAVRRRLDARASRSQDDAYFGAPELTRLKNGALDQIHQTLSHPGKVSLWDKTVGTMRHLSERAPTFKPVFDAAQRFIDDVSMLANDAADRAQRLLPRVEEWSDLTKKPISATDNKALARPLFEGTLMWGRDVDGKPALAEDLGKKYASKSADDKAQMMLRAGKIDAGVLKMWKGMPLDQYESAVNSRFQNQMLKPGIVWSANELKSMFNLNDQQVSLYQEARAVIDRSIDMTARADMLRVLGTEFSGLRELVLEQDGLQDAMVIITDNLREMAKADPDNSDRLMALHNQVIDRFDKATELMKQGYAPLSRFGQYTVDVVDQAGERQYFGMFETMREANQMAMRMRSEFNGATVEQGTMSQEAYKLFAGITPESLELFGNMLGLQSEGNEARDKAFQQYLQLTKNNQSSLKRLIHRKGIAGYSEDVGRVLASFIYSNARQAAGGLNAGTMEDAINKIHKTQGELRDVAMGLRDYIRDPQEGGQAVRGMLFAQYLGGSVASAFVNMTQPFAVTMPWLSQYGGMKAASAQMMRAFNDMRRSLTDKGFKYEADLDAALKAAQEDGTVSPQEIHQLMAQARGTGALQSGDGTRMGDARAAMANGWERTKVAWGQPFALAEQFNRRSTFIAAYRVAKERGTANPSEFARRAVLETQFLYSKANKMRWGRGPVGGTLMTFKSYSVSYLELLNRMWTQGGPEGKRAVGWALAMLVLMGGAGGLPFIEDCQDLIDGAGQLMGYNISTKHWRQELLRETLGKELGEFINSGVSGLPGAPVSVSGRLGMGNLIPGTGLFLSKPNRDRDLMEIAGPAGDLVSRGFTGVRKLLSGDVGGAAMEVSPSAVRNAAKGIDMATSGMYKDTKGYKVIDTTLAEAAAKFIGFQPKSVAQVQEANSFMLRSKNFYTQTSSDIKAQWARALFEKDDAGVERARQRVANWNRDNSDQPMVVKMPDVWKKVREMGKDRTQRIAETAPKAMRQQLRSMAAEAR